MIIEAGHYALILALLTACLQASLPLIGAGRNNGAWMNIGVNAARLQFTLIALAFLALMNAYVGSDFSVLNVAENSHTDKPLIYKMSGVWGNHEGSMLLWVLILALYGLALSFGKNLPQTLKARALAVQGMISVGFLLFILFTSNPFLRLNPPPLNGQGLNPLLQDPGLAFHPPFLYLGYVGFSMAFSFACAALLEGRVDAAWARWVRPWTLAAWCFLTLGIAMGSWWSYYTLGWGGWWYWDPVENASFIPWLAGTALLHSAIVVERRNTLKSWTIFLALTTFSFSLIGTFLVRSGVLTSVHSFASDPKRGVFILALLVVLIGGAFILFFLRASAMKGNRALFAPISREGGLLLNNMLLATAAGSVLLGTLYPLFIDALGADKISVGPPYFNIVFVPLMTPLIVAMGIGPMLGWKQGDFRGALHRLRFAVTATLAVLVLIWVIAGGSWTTLAALGGFGLAAWLFAATMSEWAWRVFLFRASWQEVAQHIRGLPRSAWGMTFAHAGMAVLIAGITGSLAWKTESLQIMHPGDTATISGYQMKLREVKTGVEGPNYKATRATFDVTKDGAPIAVMQPEHRVFAVPPQPVTDAAIHTDLMSDLYAVLGEPDGKGGYTTRLYHNPLVPWIFIGAVMMALGGGISLTDRRLRLGTADKAPKPTAAVPRGKILLLPLLAFLALTGILVWRLDLMDHGETPDLVPSAMIGKPVPMFDLPPLLPNGHHLRTADLKGKVTLVNFFASWCVPCRAEHPQLLEIAYAQKLTLIGINYQDKADQAQKWLQKIGNPYSLLAIDASGKTAIDFGVYGIPETFVIDKAGVIRFREAGPLTPEIIKEQILPLVAELNK